MAFHMLTLTSAIKRFLPPVLVNSLQVRSYLFQKEEVRRLMRCNVRFKSCYKGSRCFILATGPSIGEQDLSCLSREFCFSVGEFYLHPNASTINPAFHVEAPNHLPYDFGAIEPTLYRIQKYYPRLQHLFLGNSNYSFSFSNYLLAQPASYKGSFSFVNYQNSPQLDEFNYRQASIWDITKTPFGARTVVYAAIQIAVYMGFSEIYLLGCDHDYLTRFLFGNHDNAHFYDDNSSLLSGTVSGSSSFLSSFSLEDWFKEYYYRWKQYRLMSCYLAMRNQKIYNATIGGMLNVFPRASLPDLV